MRLAVWTAVAVVAGTLVGCGDDDEVRTTTKADGSVCALSSGSALCTLGTRPGQRPAGPQLRPEEAATARTRLAVLRGTEQPRDALPADYRGPALRVTRRAGPLEFEGRQFWLVLSKNNALCLVINAPGAAPSDGLDYTCRSGRTLGELNDYVVRPIGSGRGIVVGTVPDGYRCVAIIRRGLPSQRLKVVRNLYVTTIEAPGPMTSNVRSARLLRAAC